MKIETLDLSHLDELTLLFDEYRVWYRMPSDVKGSRIFLKERMRNQEAVVYGAFNGGNKMVGFMLLYPLFSSTRLGRLWLLNDLFVKPDFRGKRISLLLIARAKSLAEENNAVGILLETEKANRIGNQLYPRAGFHLEAQSNFYFWANERRTS